MSHLPILAIIVPLIGGILIALTGVIRPHVRAIVAIVVAGLHGTTLLLLVVRVFNNGPLEYAPGGWLPPVGIQLTVDAFSAFFLLLLAVGHPAAVLFRLATDGRSGWEDKSATLGAWYFAALAGIVVTADLFNLFVFVELATVTTLGLIARKGRENSTVAGFVYLMLASLSGVLLLASILLIYLTTGTVTSVLVAQRIATIPPHIHAIITGGMLISFGIKFGMVPLHLWQPRAYLGAGSTVSAVFSAFGMKIYLYALIRLLWLPLQAPELLPRVFNLLLVAGMVNIVVGHLAALLERNLIRMLAFSSVAHVGYILLGVAAAGRAGALGSVALVATLFHIAMHALAKATLLWSGRLFIAVRRSSLIASLQGVGTTSVPALLAFSLGALSIVGIPPTGGFASKWYIALANSLPAVITIAAGTVISLVYYARCFGVLSGAEPVETSTTVHAPGTTPASATAATSAAAATPLTFAPAPTPQSNHGRRFRPAVVLVLLLGLASMGAGPAEQLIRRVLHTAAATLISAGATL